jgi:hypothetical protein
MVDDDDDRVEKAGRLAEEGDARAAAAFRVIALDQAVDDDVRLEAARLAEGDTRWAAAAFRAIAADEGVDGDVREEAALALAEIS